MPNKRTAIDLGCGINRPASVLGVDRNARSHPDVIADLDAPALPFRDSSFPEARIVHVIEHVHDVMHLMEEVHRILIPGGSVFIATPHYTDSSSFGDVTHRSHLNSFALRHFTSNHGGYEYYTNARFEEIATRVVLLRLWRLLGFEFLINRSRGFRKFWEYYLCYLIRGKAIEWRMRALK